MLALQSRLPGSTALPTNLESHGNMQRTRGSNRLKRLPWKRRFSERHEAEIKSREMGPKAGEEELQHL